MQLQLLPHVMLHIPYLYYGQCHALLSHNLVADHIFTNPGSGPVYILVCLKLLAYLIVGIRFTYIQQIHYPIMKHDST